MLILAVLCLHVPEHAVGQKEARNGPEMGQKYIRHAFTLALTVLLPLFTISGGAERAIAGLSTQFPF